MAKLIKIRSACYNDAVRLGLAFALTATLSAGCFLDRSGLSARADAGGTGGGTSVSSTSGGTGGASTGTAGGAVATSSSGVTTSGTTTPCTSTGAEICDDELDNDCNQATDCEDPACAAGFVCIPAIPSGWSPVAFSAQSRPACPGGYTMELDVVSAPSSASTCACTCTEQDAASCTQGGVGIASNGTTCPVSPNFTLDANGSQCGSTNLNTVASGKVKIAPLPPTQGACTGTPSGTAPPLDEGRSCDATAVGVGCANGGACVASPSASFVSCIARDDATPCPPGFPNGRSVGTNATDTRACTQCMCGTDASCSNPKLTLYSNSSCGGGDHALPVTGACDPVNDGSGNSYKSFKYTADIVNPSCQTTSESTPTGSLVLVGERTVCCQ